MWKITFRKRDRVTPPREIAHIPSLYRQGRAVTLRAWIRDYTVVGLTNGKHLPEHMAFPREGSQDG